jgi:hypothetical protein
VWLVVVGVVVQLLGSLLTILYRHPALGPIQRLATGRQFGAR